MIPQPVFSLDASKSLTLLTPNGGESLITTNDLTISWNSTNITGDVNLELYRGNTKVLTIATDTANVGSYEFNPPATLADGDDYRIRISAESGTIYDFSNNYFTIISALDTDHDGLPNNLENAGCTYFDNPDSDADGLLDGIEDANHNGTVDAGETNPCNLDTDGDGMPDGWEVIHHLDPTIDDARGDADGDGLSNLAEYHYHTDPENEDSDGDGILDGDEINNGTDPMVVDTVAVHLRQEQVTVSLAGDNRLLVEVINWFPLLKTVDFALSGLDADWYTIAAADQQFIMNPGEKRVIAIQLHLPQDCGIPEAEHPFVVTSSWEHDGENRNSSDSGTLVVTSKPSVYPLTIPHDTKLAGNTIMAAWRTDVPVTSCIKYRKLGAEEFIEVPVAVDQTEHRATLSDLDYFTYYKYFTESRSACGEATVTDTCLVRTGRAIKFLNNENEFWVDRDYDQRVTLEITNTDIIAHTFSLSVINDNPDITVGFVGDGIPTRSATLEPDQSTEVELVIHAPDALQTLYDIYLKMVSDEGEYDSFVDFSHAVIHVRPFVANLALQPVESTPGMMTSRFRLINYGDTLGDIEVYVDAASKQQTTINPAINHARLEIGEFIEFDLTAQEYTTGTVYARSGDYVTSAAFELGCPDGTELTTYTVNDVSIVAVIKDWYCTNKMDLDLPFAVPRGFDHDDLSGAALEVNFSLPMAYEKYDPHTVLLAINGTEIATLEDTIPQGSYTFRFPTSLINLGVDAPAENRLQMRVDGITEGHYIVVTDFKIFLNVDEMQVDLCVPPQDGGWWQPKVVLSDPETRITGIGPAKKFRPGEMVEIAAILSNNDNPDNPPHAGQLTLTIANDSASGAVPTAVLNRTVSVPGGQRQKVFFSYRIPPDADDIEYTLSAAFANTTMGTTSFLSNRPGFWVRTPLIIVHGIKGSVLADGQNELWSPKSLIPSVCDNGLEQLKCDEDGNPENPNVKATRAIKDVFSFKILNMLFKTDTFQGLENYLGARQHAWSPTYKIHPMGGGTLDFDSQSLVVDGKDPEDLFYFVYDWRLDNSWQANHTGMANKLESFIDKVTTELGYAKVNLVAHSMGGLVCKSMLQQNSSMQPKVNKLILLGTPNLGAVESFSAIAHGLEAPMFGNRISSEFIAETEIFNQVLKGFGVADATISGHLQNITDALDAVLKANDPMHCSEILEWTKIILTAIGDLKVILHPLSSYVALVGTLDELAHLYSLDQDVNFINDARMKELSQNMPGLYQLLPSTEYFTLDLDGYYSLDDGNQVNQFSSSTAMAGKIREVGNDTLYAEAQSLHNAVDAMNLSGMPFKSYMVVGCGRETPIQISEHSSAGHLTLDFGMGDGDGTVPLFSAMQVNTDKKYAARYAKHLNLPSQKGVRLLIRSILKGYENNFATSSRYPVTAYDGSGGFCGLPSGVKIIVTPKSGPSAFVNPTGGTTPGSVIVWPHIKEEGTSGPDGFTGFTGNTIHTGIIGSDYNFTNEGVEIFIPDGGVYVFEFKGIDGEYIDVKLELMTKGGVIKTYIFYDIPLDSNGNGRIVIDDSIATTDPVVELDQDDDGDYDDGDIPPDSVLDQEEAKDKIGPTTVMSINGTAIGPNIYLPGATVSLAATDNSGGCGVQVTYYRFQGDTSFSKYTAPITLTESGSYGLTCYSVDRNLNLEMVQTCEIMIDSNGPPQVVLVSPTNLSNGSSKSTDIQIQFSEAMNEALLSDSDITVTGSISGSHTGSISYDQGDDTLTFSPVTDFVLCERISVVIDGSIQDLVGISFDGNGNGSVEGSPIDDYTWSFNVKSCDGLAVRITDVDTLNCPILQASLIVTDEYDQLVTDLTASDFFVFEDGLLQLPIAATFIDHNTFPISVCLALDYSGSMGTPAIADMEDAAVSFIDNMLAEDAGEIIKFATSVEVVQELTTDKPALVDAVYADIDLGTNTALYDSIYQAVADFSSLDGRKAVIVLTDGKDHGSVCNQGQIINYAQSEGVPVFTIGLGASIDEIVLGEIAEQTGGLYYNAPDSSELVDIYESIAIILKNQYQITYQTSFCDGQEHELQINADDGSLAGCSSALFTLDGFSFTDIYVDSDGNCNGEALCFATISEACQVVGDALNIKVSSGNYIESLLLNQDKEINLTGGWNEDYSILSSYATVKGSLTISDGCLTVENLVIY